MRYLGAVEGRLAADTATILEKYLQKNLKKNISLGCYVECGDLQKCSLASPPESPPTANPGTSRFISWGWPEISTIY